MYPFWYSAPEPAWICGSYCVRHAKPTLYCALTHHRPNFHRKPGGSSSHPGCFWTLTRVALYTRVSTEDQAKEGFSLGAQLERLRLYAAAQDWSVAGEYIDEGHSGRTTNRPQ